MTSLWLCPQPQASTLNSTISNGKLWASRANLPQFARMVTQWLHSHGPIGTIEEMGKFAQDICWALENALEAVGKNPKKKSGKSTPWWTGEC